MPSFEPNSSAGAQCDPGTVGALRGWLGGWLAGLNWLLVSQVLPAGELAPKVAVSRLNLVQVRQRAVWAECSLRRAQGASDWVGAAGP